jgi:predicted RNA-binding protein with PIN domain
MFFLIDGYNLLFSCIEGRESIEKKRARLVLWIQREFKRMRLRGVIVFDGSHRRDEESGLSYPSPMECAFTPKGQSADENILERIEILKNRKDAAVVSNDLGLQRRVNAMGAKAMSNDQFLEWLLRRGAKKKSKRSPMKDSPREIERLNQIFEERYLKNLTDDLEGWE